jgi:Asp-tRNA(Asn)/Glu-tRNA(Gln) amidotransferase A subunit family amidase
MLHTLSIGELARRLAAGEISSVELTRHFLARIERFNPGLNAVITLTADRALDASFIKIFSAPKGSGRAVDRGCSTISSRLTTPRSWPA